jgi:hypothetical protein
LAPEVGADAAAVCCPDARAGVIFAGFVFPTAGVRFRVVLTAEGFGAVPLPCDEIVEVGCDATRWEAGD